MLEREANQSQVSRVRQRLEDWRERHGGRGRRIPEELWKAAVEVARGASVDWTARALRLDRGILAGRVEAASAAPSELLREAAIELRQPSSGFVELDARGLCAPGQMVVRFEGRDGEKLQFELSGTCTLNALELARAFWSRPR